MFKVEYVETSIDQKLNHAWNCPIIKVTYGVSIFHLKAGVDTQNEDTKVICKSVQKCECMVYFYASIFHKIISFFKKKLCGTSNRR